VSGKSLERIAFWVFWPMLALWTWKLVEPKPLPESIDDLFSGLALLRLIASKTLHALSYAFLTVLAGYWLPKRRPILTFALSLLMLHAVATEIIQTMVPNRSGRATDVLIDWMGISLGLAIARTKWRLLWGKSLQ
jgi:hypothetical protein